LQEDESIVNKLQLDSLDSVALQFGSLITKDVQDSSMRIIASAWPRNLGSSIATEVFRISERFLAIAPSVMPLAGKIACKAGCDWCCYQDVVLSPPEALALGDFLRKELSAFRLSSLTARVALQRKLVQGLTSDARYAKHIPCPLLEGKQCIAYPVRPLACRGESSFNMDACKFDNKHRQIPAYLGYMIVASSALAGIINAIECAGLESYPLEIIPALEVVLVNPRAGLMWSKGSKVFSRARWRH
jgi:Fe-S-cluster containining protein